MTRRALGLSIAAIGCVFASNAHAAPEVAHSADAFVDSIGVNVHLNFGDTSYAQFDTLVKPKLLSLGIRHVRDGVITGTGVDGSHPFYRHVRDLGTAGIRFSMITGMDTSFGKATDLTQLVDVFGWSGGAIEDFEGINEPDLQTIPGKPKDAWIAITRAQQKALFDTVKGAPALASVRVLGPSVTSLNDALPAIGDLSAFVDYGNAHPYPGGFCPACGTFYGQDVDTFLPEEEKVFGGKPMVMTETGYTNALGAGPGGNRPVSEKASAKYLPRLLFEFFNHGFVRTYPYEFLDEKPDSTHADIERNFGIVRQDGTEKPAYVAEKSLIALLTDVGPAFTPTSLDWSVVAPVSFKLHHSLLQKRDGTFFLVMWREVDSYDTGWRQGPPSTEDVSLRKDLDEPSVTVDLTVNGTFAIARVHAQGDDGLFTTSDPARTADGKLVVKVRDAISIVELGNPPIGKDAGSDSLSSDGATDSSTRDALVDGMDDGGETSDGDADTIPQPSDASDSSGCGCALPGRTPSTASGLALFALGAILVRRRRPPAAR